MENTLENKAKYFAQHYGQRAVSSSNDHLNINVINDSFLGDLYDWDKYHKSLLKLNSLFKITNEDAIEIAKICFDEKGYEYRFIVVDNLTEVHQDIISVQVEFLMNIPNATEYWDIFGHCQIDRQDFDINYLSKKEDIWFYDVIDSAKIVSSYQYLQSKGYALPWMGLSIEQLIKYEWLKPSLTDKVINELNK